MCRIFRVSGMGHASCHVSCDSSHETLFSTAILSEKSMKKSMFFVLTSGDPSRIISRRLHEKWQFCHAHFARGMLCGLI